jgi:hypothetical protein
LGKDCKTISKKKKKLKEKRARAYSSDRSLVYKSRVLSSNSSTAKTKM